MTKVNVNGKGAEGSTLPQGKVIAQNSGQAVKVIAEGSKELSPLSASIIEAQKKLAELQAQRKAQQVELKKQAEALNKQIAEVKAKAKAEAKEAKEAQNKLIKQAKEAKEGNTKGAICGRIIAQLTIEGKPLTAKVVGTLLAEQHAKVTEVAKGTPQKVNVSEGIFVARYCLASIEAFNKALATVPAEVV